MSDGLHKHSSCIGNTTVTSACVTADVVTYTVKVITRRSSTRAMMPEKLIVVFHIGHGVIVLLQADCSIWGAVVCPAPVIYHGSTFTEKKPMVNFRMASACAFPTVIMFHG